MRDVGRLDQFNPLVKYLDAVLVLGIEVEEDVQCEHLGGVQAAAVES